MRIIGRTGFFYPKVKMANLDVRIKLRGTGLAQSDELSLRHKFQDEVERRGIGKDLGGGSGFGEMDITVQVSDAATGRTQLRELARELGIQEGLTIETSEDDLPPSNKSPFGDTISSYSRQQALDDGYLIDVSKSAKEAGIRFPVAMTRAVFDKYVAVPEELEGIQDESGRLWDIVWMLTHAIRSTHSDTDEMRFRLNVQNHKNGPTLVTLKSLCGPGDDCNPVITVI